MNGYRNLTAFFNACQQARDEIAARWDVVHGDVYEWLK